MLTNLQYSWNSNKEREERHQFDQASEVTKHQFYKIIPTIDISNGIIIDVYPMSTILAGNLRILFIVRTDNISFTQEWLISHKSTIHITLASYTQLPG